VIDLPSERNDTGISFGQFFFRLQLLSAGLFLDF